VENKMTKEKQGLLINYEYCTGCYTCQIACAQEYKWPPGMGGIKVMEIVQKLASGKNYLAYIPFPTELCTLCIHRTRKGLEPACVKHCMSKCMKHGPIEELAKEMKNKPRTVLWSPK
jgi:Fe-S-cluster-containing dehydrogenase component